MSVVLSPPERVSRLPLRLGCGGRSLLPSAPPLFRQIVAPMDLFEGIDDSYPNGLTIIVWDSGVQLGNDELQRLAVTLFITRCKATKL